MANKIFGAIKTIGGTDGSLDTVKQATLTDGDLAVVGNLNDESHWYRYESSSGATESNPQVVRPDDTPAGGNPDGYANGRWILTSIQTENLKVYGDAVIDGTLTQTGNAGFTGNVDIDGTLTFDGAGPAVTVIKDEDNMVSDSATALATQQSIKKYVDDIAGALITNVDRLAGFIVRPKFTWSDADTITIGAGRVHLLGTAQGEDIYKWDTTLTFDFGSGGSNAGSSDLGTSEWHYLYIDDSALAGGSGTLLTAAQFLNSTTAPTWDASECGWYNGADRCIAAFYVDSGGDIEEFFQIGRDIMWADTVNLAHSWTQAWKDQTMRVPSLATNLEAIVNIWVAANNYGYGYWRTNGQTGSTGHICFYAYNSGGGDNYRWLTMTDTRVVTDTSGVVEFKGGSTAAAGTNAKVYQDGYVLPEGM
jgi:hypothetical protein